jgi:hypothetical protein
MAAVVLSEVRNTKWIVAIPIMDWMNPEGISIALPATGMELNSRKVMRSLVIVLRYG